MVAISSCLTGIKCRYNATDNHKPLLINGISDSYIAICPEILGYFIIPREACEIVGGSGEDVLNRTARVIDNCGVDITEQMIRGAEKALHICLECGVTKAYLQSKSPTCGCGEIYDGSFSRTLRVGNGIFTALLNQNGIEVIEVI